MDSSIKQDTEKAPFIVVSKIDVSRRQLETAIQLYFKNRDVVSIHTLSWAVYNLLSDIIKKQGKTADLDRDLSYVVPERRKEVKKIFSQPGNYFKHADTDNDEPLKFYFKSSDMHLLASCRMYYTLTQESTALMVIYKAWFHLSYPGLLEPNNENIIETQRKNYNLDDRTRFLNDMWPIALELTMN